MVKIRDAIYAFFRTLSRMDSSEKIKLSDQIYIGLPDTRLTLVSLVGEAAAIKLSVDDARRLFRSIKSACDMQDIKQIKLGELSWKTDARTGATDGDRIAVRFDGPTGSTSTMLNRDQFVAALAEFETKFGRG